jgi:hypothetical protein
MPNREAVNCRSQVATAPLEHKGIGSSRKTKEKEKLLGNYPSCDAVIAVSGLTWRPSVILLGCPCELQANNVAIAM